MQTTDRTHKTQDARLQIKDYGLKVKVSKFAKKILFPREVDRVDKMAAQVAIETERLRKLKVEKISNEI